MLRSKKVFLWLLVLGLAIQSHAAGSRQDNPPLRVFVIDDAGSPQLLLDAERTASRVFLKTGVVVDWVHCSQPFPSRCPTELQPGTLAIRILPEPRSRPSEMFGVSFLGPGGSGAYADVFLAPIQQLRENATDISVSATLGAVMAHELGHLLLGNNAHSSQGIMQARWQSQQLKDVGKGRMQFTPEQARRIRDKVIFSQTVPERLALEASLEH